MMNQEKLAQDKQIIRHKHKDIHRIIEFKYSNTDFCMADEEEVEQNSNQISEYNLEQISEDEN